ncbi:MAG: methyltransferase domain-containing protein [Methanospirillaceae archaeon]|nr:methyltransferase domain-containing protein [Methanospirillaceae archaeon]
MQYHSFFTDRIHLGDRVLDIGCGNGALAYSVAQKAGGIVTAIDISKTAIDTANRMHKHDNIRYICGDALDNIPEGEYDVLIMSNVLEHIQNRTGFLRSLAAHFPKARYLLRVPRKDRHWSVYYREELGLYTLLDETHCIEYTPDLFNRELETSGLTIVYTEFAWEEIWAEARRQEHAG